MVDLKTCSKTSISILYYHTFSNIFEGGQQKISMIFTFEKHSNVIDDLTIDIWSRVNSKS